MKNDDKVELIEEVSRVLDMNRRDSEPILLEAILESIVGSLRSGDKVEIWGFGSFGTRRRQPRVGRNPKTGTRVDVPSKRVPYFRPFKELRDLLDEAASHDRSLHATAASDSPSGSDEVAGRERPQRRG